MKLVTPILIATLAAGCAELQKPQAFLDAEKAYQTAANDPIIQKYSADQLAKANKTLLTSATATSEEDLASIAYISSTQINTAKHMASAEQAMQNSKDLLVNQEQLVAAAVIAEQDQSRKQLLAEQEQAQQQLLAMQASEAEREILLAFGKIEFVTGTSDLVPGAATGIDMLAGYMSKFKAKKVTIAGHTDSSGSAKLNKQLSQQRADFIRNVLVTKGVAENRITALGYGQSQPISENTTRAGRQKNRRIEIAFQ